MVLCGYICEAKIRKKIAMKKILILFVIGLLLASCKKEIRTDYIINGNAEGAHNGIRVYLKYVDQRGEGVVKDTAIIMNEKFSMNGVVDEPTVHFLSVDGTQGDAIFMLENSAIDIDVNMENPIESKVTGSESNEGFVLFQDGLAKIRKEAQDIMKVYRQVKMPEGAAKRDSLSKELEKVGNRMLEHPLNFVKENNDTYFSLNLIGLEANKPKFDVVSFMEAFDNLTPELKSSPKGLEVKERLDELYKKYEKIAHLEIGKIAPNFEAPTPDGDIVSLNNLKGKVTIIDFWAAWCGPCRKENPNVVRIYNQYHDQGLEIVGVSLDGERRQKDPKKAWLNAIEQDKLTWNQVSHLKYFNDPIAQLYNIKSIPATYILDAEGKIVAKNLRGKALENKVKELLEKS